MKYVWKLNWEKLQYDFHLCEEEAEEGFWPHRSVTGGLKSHMQVQKQTLEDI